MRTIGILILTLTLAAALLPAEEVMEGSAPAGAHRRDGEQAMRPEGRADPASTPVPRGTEVAPEAAREAAGGAAGAEAAVPGDGEWVCPPCSCGADGDLHSGPGRCPVCGMKLIRRSEAMTATILLFDGVQIIDYTGPWEVLGQAHIKVATASPDGKPVTTAMGMKVTPDYAMASAPVTEILLLPGGEVEEASTDGAVQAWIRDRVERAKHVLSVCNGAFFLARAGLLDGLSATTFYGLLHELEEIAPKTRVVTDQRFVDNGKIITSAGLSSGIDGAIHLVEKIRGRGAAEALALHLEYDWDPDRGFARGALAEGRFPRLRLPQGADVEILGTKGDRDRWERRLRVRSPLDREGLAAEIEKQVSTSGGWSRAGAPGGGASGALSEWRKAGERGRAWKLRYALTPVPGESGAIDLTETIERDPR